jgi:hypothetical protein
MSKRIRFAASVVALAALAPLAYDRQEATGDADVLAAKSNGNGPAESPHERTMRAIATDYAKWGRADENARWAPVACEPGGLPDAMPTGGKISAIEDPPRAHARKFYFLFAKDKAAYLAASGATEGRGAAKRGPATRPAVKEDVATSAFRQIVVKEAWAPVEITADEAKRTAADQKAHRGGKWYKARDRGDLFVMARLADEKAAGTDKGWVYGVVTPGSPATVKEAGLLRQCAECHHQAGDGRLYGVRRGE